MSVKIYIVRNGKFIIFWDVVEIMNKYFVYFVNKVFLYSYF